MCRATHRRLISFALAAALVVAGCGLGETVAPEPGSTVPGEELPASDDMLVVGDWGAGTDSQDQVAEAMADYARGREVAAILTTGDNFYSDTADELMKPFGWASGRDIPFLIAWGNHDIETQRRIQVVEDALGDPPRWVVHNWGEVDIFILDSNQVENDSQIDFLVDSLAESQSPTIAVFHHPPYTCGKHPESQEVIETWIPRFDEDVFLVLNGHDHNYQRFEKGDVTYVVTGGGGRHLYELRACGTDSPDLITGEVTYHFLVLHQDERVSVTAIDASGDVIDEFSVELP